MNSNGLFSINNETVLHITVRLQWHDHQWDGRICKMPSKNIYCLGNHSLLSTRIRRRRKLELEEGFSEKYADEAIRHNYIPPCYWSINLLGHKEINVKHVHPFCDFYNKARNGGIKPIIDIIEPNSVLSWCFKFSFTRESESPLRYPTDLENRLDHYLSYIIPNKSVAILYLNYSNPINGDKHRYLIAGAALIKGVKKPQKYEFDESYYKELKKKFGGYFPDIEWSFHLILDPGSIVLIPYHQYYEKLHEAKDEEKGKFEELINEIIVEIDKKTLIPHFKYVSMHISTDKTLFILYKILNSLHRIAEHGIVDRNYVEKNIERTRKLIDHLWKLRGEYISLKRALMALGEYKGIYGIDRKYGMFKKVEKEVEKFLNQYGTAFIKALEEGNRDQFRSLLNTVNKDRNINSWVVGILRDLIHDIEGRKGEWLNFLRLLSKLDLTFIQMLRITRMAQRKEINARAIVENPYSLIYTYKPEYELQEKEWFLEFMDFDLELYQLDIPLMPDPEFSDKRWEFLPKNGERLLAAIYEDLYEKSALEGITVVNKADLVKSINEKQILKLYEGHSPEVSDSDIDNVLENYKNSLSEIVWFTIDKEEDYIFQLRAVREIEQVLENFVKELLRKSSSNSNVLIKNYISDIIMSETSKLRHSNIPEKQKQEFINTQTEILDKALTRSLLIITGGAGTGKTETIVNLSKLYSLVSKKPIIILTPTGKSSLVIRERLEKETILGDGNVDVLTIHRFLYSYGFEKNYGNKKERVNLVNLIDKCLTDIRFLREFKEYIDKNPQLKFEPKVLIIDEASMIDEILLYLLFSLLDVSKLEHMIIVGDSNQLPPIGIGKPFVDIMNFLIEEGSDAVIALESPIRFSIDVGIWAFSQAIADVETPIEDLEKYSDDTFEIRYFENDDDLREKLKEIIKTLSSISSGLNMGELTLLDLLNNFLGFGINKEPKLDKLQILTPTKYKGLGADYINNRLILNDKQIQECDYLKLINEENRYETLNSYGRTLIIPNGSLGFLMKIDKRNYKVYFKETEEILNRLKKAKINLQRYLATARMPTERKSYRQLISHLKNDIKKVNVKLGEIRNEILGIYKETDINVSLGYAITVHKAQGSDFEYTIIILPEKSAFISRELLYTALTRAKCKTFLLLNSHLKNNLRTILRQIKMLSEIEKRHTFLFKYRKFSSVRYPLELGSGKVIYLKSKAEHIIAKTLDNLANLGVKFYYEPKDFEKYDIIPDFKLIVDGKIFYLEHLGLMDKSWYMKRWEWKKRQYERLEIIDYIITTSEPTKGEINIEGTIKKIIYDIKNNKLIKTDDRFPSRHHYVCQNVNHT